MARQFKRLSRFKNREDSGFASNANGRFIKKDGLPNVEKRGVSLFNRFSWYHTMLNLSSTRFIIYLVCGYISINILFAFVYYLIGIEHLTGIDKNNMINEMIDVFFFSSQTFTTVGYGRIAPVGFSASLVATFEAFIGLLAFAIATGLFYGRFSRPRAFLMFSEYALISPYQEVTGLMFRMAPYKNNALTNAEVIISCAIEVMDEGISTSKFFRLKPELETINSLALNWTVVHKIDEESPLFGFNKEDFQAMDIEIIIQIRAFDEVFANTVVQSTSYVSAEIIHGAKFEKMYYPHENRSSTVLDLSKISSHILIEEQLMLK